MEENKTEQGYCYKYPRPAVTTDVVLFAMVDSQMKVLLIQRGRDSYKGQWAFPGGFLNMDETAEVGALRELKEETGPGIGPRQTVSHLHPSRPRSARAHDQYRLL